MTFSCVTFYYTLFLYAAVVIFVTYQSIITKKFLFLSVGAALFDNLQEAAGTGRNMDGYEI